jgi:hypothetical protein
MTKKRWSDLTPGQQTAVLVAISVQLSLAATAWVDLARRPASAVRGPKLAWAAAIAVNFVGPISYFALGRRVPITAMDDVSSSTTLTGSQTARS